MLSEETAMTFMRRRADKWWAGGWAFVGKQKFASNHRYRILAFTSPRGPVPCNH